MKEKKQMKEKILLAILVAGILGFAIFIATIWSTNKIEDSIPLEIARSQEYDLVQEGENNVDGTNEHVKFDAFFLRDLDGDGYAEALRGSCRKIGTQDTLYMEINVLTEGYLKDGKIEINGKNFYLQTSLPKDAQLKNNYIGNNVKNIELNTLNNGTQKTLMALVRSGDYTYSSKKSAAIGKDINNYTRDDNEIILTGIYVDAAGNEINVEKKVKLTVDWYGTIKATISATDLTYTDLNSRINKENQTLSLDFAVKTEDTVKELNLSKNHIEGTIPELNGYEPLEVIINNQNIEFVYDKDTRMFFIDNVAKVSSDGKITTSVSSTNSYDMTIIYPLQAYESLDEDAVAINIPVQTYFEGYNNPNEEFYNPYKSNTAKSIIAASFRKPEGTVIQIDSRMGKYVTYPNARYVISKEKPMNEYNGIAEETEEDDTYIVKWNVHTGENGTTNGARLKETRDGESQASDHFIKMDGSTISMENIVSNIGVYFTGAEGLLGKDGWIKIYNDETDDLIATFTKNNWDTYTSTKPYKYEVPIKHIRVETSGTIPNGSLDIYSIKKIDDDYIINNFTKEQFNQLRYIETTLAGYSEEKSLGTDIRQALYEAPYSIATISLSKDGLSTQLTEKNIEIYINAAKSDGFNQVGWVNGSYLIKLPEEILTIEINNVIIDNLSVDVTSYEVIENEAGRFIKINTSNKNEDPQGYTITINCNATPDPRISTVSRKIELYASNDSMVDYYYSEDDIYDVNNNLNIDESINKTSSTINLVAPNGLLTNQVIQDFDDEGSVVISPEIAEITPKYGNNGTNNQATIGVQLKNNYSNTISEVVIIGKIPFEGNGYVINGGDLNSEFTTTMESTGIIVPNELSGKVTVYYSENKTPSKDLSDTNNGWTTATNVTDWSKIKTFLIDFGSTEVKPQEENIFYYTVNIPKDIDLNKVSYSHHGIYFALHTEQGKYLTQTEPNKIGIRISDKYSLELVKYQKDKAKKVSGATYKIKEVGSEEAKTETTDEEGNISINDLYAEKTYEISEIKTSSDYELNNETIKFVVHANMSTGELTIEKLEGTTRENVIIQKNQNNEYKAKIVVEDEARVKLKIIKTEEGTENRLKGIVYKLSGEGISTSGKRITTNDNGEIDVKGLKVGAEYTLEEIKAEGYYLGNAVTFKVVNDKGTYKVEILDGTVKQASITEENDIPQVSISLEDEKIPTYTLELTKIKRIENLGEENTEDITYLEGAKFKLYKDGKEVGTFISDANGKIIIDNLYEYVDGKDFEATYVLKETLPPEGYTKVKDITFKVQEVEGKLEFIEELTQGQTAKTYTSEGNKVNVIVEDNPSFKLIKKDGETNEVLANCKFIVYNIDNGEVPATNSKGEIIGTKEKINGKEYYTVTTDSNGEITLDLTEGLYKLVEVEADYKYNIEGNTYYFGIGASREPNRIMATEWIKKFEDSNTKFISNDLLVSTFSGTTEIDGKTIGNEDRYNIAVVKYKNDEEIEWIKVKELSDKYVSCNNVIETSDGGYVIVGTFSNAQKIGNIDVNTNGYNDAIIIKLNESLEVEWVKTFGGTSSRDEINDVVETLDGGYVATGEFGETIQIGNKRYTCTNTYTDPINIKYSKDGEIEWVSVFGGNDMNYSSCATSTEDGGCIVVLNTWATSIKIEDQTIQTNGNIDSILIKYSKDGVVDWIKKFGGNGEDKITSIVSTIDGGFAYVGEFRGTIQIEGHEIVSKGSSDQAIVKYNKKAEVEWIKTYGSKSKEEYSSIIQTSDEGFLVAGYYSNNVEIEDEKLNSIYPEDLLIIKYDKDGNKKWTKNCFTGYSYNTPSLIEGIDGSYIIGIINSATIKSGNITIMYKNGKSSYAAIKIKEKEVPNVYINGKNDIGGSGESRFLSVVETLDGGCITAGCFTETIQVGNYTITSNGSYDGIVVKYDENRNIEWIKQYGEEEDDRVNSVVVTNDGGCLVAGYCTETDGNCIGLVIKYNVNGEVEWEKRYGNNGDLVINSIAVNSDDSFVIGGYFNEKIQIENKTVTSNGGYDGITIKCEADGEVEWIKTYGGSSDDKVNSVTINNDGNCIVGGEFQESIQIDNKTITAIENLDQILIKYKDNGEIEWINNYGTYSKDTIHSVVATSDGGCIVLGEFKDDIQIGNQKLLASSRQNGLIIKINSFGEEEWANNIGGGNCIINSIIETGYKKYVATGIFNGTAYADDIILMSKGTMDSMVLEIGEKGEIEWAQRFGGSEQTRAMSISATTDGRYILAGYYNGIIELGNNSSIASSGEYNGFLLNITPLYGASEATELEVKNKRKQYKITTDIEEIDGIKGGNILGEDKNPYEVVKHGDSSVKEIKMTPEENYEIIGITVNGEKYPFEKKEDGSYIMPQFTNVTEDKHVVVKYGLSSNKIIINKVDSKTKEPLEGATFKLDQIDEREEPKAENIGELTDNGEYYFIENEGKYESTNQGKARTTSNSYIPIDLSDYEGKYNLTVNAKISSDKNHDYGYATITESTDKVSAGTTLGVNRFIRISGEIDNTDYTTVLDGGKMYYLHIGYYKNASGDAGEDKFTVNSIKLTLNDSELYHTQVTTNVDGQGITQLPFGKYAVTEITSPEGYDINESIPDIEFRANGVNEFTIEDEAKAKITVHHYIKGTTEKIAEDEMQEGEIDKEYKTSPKIDLSNYELEVDTNGDYIIPDNATGEFKPGEQIITYYYVKKQVPLTVHHYIEGTTNSVPLNNGEVAKDVNSKGNEGEEYTTTALSEELSSKYELVGIPDNSTGIYDYDEVVVTYFYREREPVAKLESNIEKAGDRKISSKESKVYYEINYTATIKDFAGYVNLQIVDTLPYEIDEENSELDGGIYDSESKTITWEENIENIDTDLTNGKEEVNRTKTLSLKYIYPEEVADIATPLENKVTGTIKLLHENNENPEEPIVVKEEEKEDTHEVPVEVPTKVIVHHYVEGSTIKLVDDEEINGIVKEEYTTSKSDKISKNYSVVDETPEKYSGIMTEETIEVIYYYRLQDETVEDSIEKTAVATEKINGKETLTQRDGVVKYTIKYNSKIKDYIGKAKITVVDNLPAKIDIVKSDLKEGTYNAINNTITWEEVVYNIDTYANGDYEYTFEKEILIVYEDQDESLPLVNTTVGRTATYYPNTDPNKPGEEKTVVTKEDTATVEQKYEPLDTKIESSIQKIGTEKIISSTEEIEYTINYKATIKEYKGDIVLTLTDTLPYKIDALNSELDEGIYNEDDQTITWTEEIKDIDTVVNGDYEVSVNKSIKVAYIDLDTTADKITNIVHANIELTKTHDNYEKETLFDTEIEIKGKVIVRYIDEDGNEIANKEGAESFVGNSYRTIPKDIPGYKYEGVEGEEEGSFIEGTIEVVYKYKKHTAMVVARYLEKGTETPLAEETILTGMPGDNYETERKVIEYYKKAEPEPENANGEMVDGTIYVTYYYEKIPAGKVVVKYLDIDTKEEITYKDENNEISTYGYELEGFLGDDYTTETKEIPYYELVEEKLPQNKEGKYLENDQLVVYYYKKMLFNIGIEKTIKEAKINGQNINVKDNTKLIKLEVKDKEIDSTEILVAYRLLVTNTEEVNGTAEIVDVIPDELEIADSNPSYWRKLANDNITTEVDLNAGESKELEVILKWKQGNNNLGTIKNIAEITKTENKANYLDNILSDNTSTAEAIITVKTGQDIRIAVIGIAIISICGMASYVLIDLYRQQRAKHAR